MTDSQTQDMAAVAEGPKAKAGKAKPKKVDTLVILLRSKRGAPIEQLQQASGWQANSVRGFLSGTVRKKPGLTLVAEAGKDGLGRYRIEKSAAAE